MQTRNFYILVASIMIAMGVFWLSVYAMIELDINPFQDPNIITFKGNGLNREISLEVNQLKSDSYHQVIDRTFHIINFYETEYTMVYTGISLWSILDTETLLDGSPSELTFQFYGRDGYHSPKPLNLSIAQYFPDLVILAYEENGAPLFEDGPLRSVIDQTIVPAGEFASQYSVSLLNTIIINYAA
jgi:hypothetical protein